MIDLNEGILLRALEVEEAGDVFLEFCDSEYNSEVFLLMI